MTVVRLSLRIYPSSEMQRMNNKIVSASDFQMKAFADIDFTERLLQGVS
jgi:hypothetical protein